MPIRRQLRILRGKCRKVIGIDVDEQASSNPFLDEFHRIEGPRWPIADGSIDLCVSDSVLEHIPDPEAFFAESARVLRAGGYLCLRTPNRLGYVALLASLIPNRLHAAVLKKAQATRKESDVFPTLYRCNTIGRIRRMLRKYGFEHCVYGYDAEPQYLQFSRLAFALGVLCNKLLPGMFKNCLFVFAKKL